MRELEPETLDVVRECAWPIYEEMSKAADTLWDCAKDEIH
jgi:hypothetical protein